MNRVARTLLNVMRIEVLLGIGLVIWVMSVEVKADDTEGEGEVIKRMTEEQLGDYGAMSLCTLQSEQFGKVVKLRIETNSLAEVSFQCFMNGGFGSTDKGLKQYQLMQEAYEAEITKTTPSELCNVFSNFAFEQIKVADVGDVDTWVQEGENFWFKRCMDASSD